MDLIKNKISRLVGLYFESIFKQFSIKISKSAIPVRSLSLKKSKFYP